MPKNTPKKCEHIYQDISKDSSIVYACIRCGEKLNQKVVVV